MPQCDDGNVEIDVKGSSQEDCEEEEKHVERSKSSHRVAAEKAKNFFLLIPKSLRLPVLFALIIFVLAIPTLPMALVVSTCS